MAIETEVKELQEKTQEILKKQLVQEIISKNEIEFVVGTTKYRVKRPSYADKQKVMAARTQKFLALLRDKDQLREKDLIDLYTTRGIDIAQLDVKITDFQNQRHVLNLKIGKLLEDNASVENLEPLKKSLESIIADQNKAIMEKSVYLELSIESQVNVYAYVYMGALICEKLVVTSTETVSPIESWCKSWASYDDFIKETEDVVNNVVWYTAMVAKNEIPSL